MQLRKMELKVKSLGLRSSYTESRGAKIMCISLFTDFVLLRNMISVSLGRKVFYNINTSRDSS